LTPSLNSPLNPLINPSPCNYHNIEEYFDEIDDSLTDCVPENVSFSKDVFPIIVNNCSACHNDITHYKDRNYDTYEGIADVAASGKLLRVINHESGIANMPQNADKLDQCYIDIIEQWINDGAENN